MLKLKQELIRHIGNGGSSWCNTFLGQELGIYFIFCFDVDDPSKYICLGVLC